MPHPPQKKSPSKVLADAAGAGFNATNVFVKYLELRQSNNKDYLRDIMNLGSGGGVGQIKDHQIVGTTCRKPEGEEVHGRLYVLIGALLDKAVQLGGVWQDFAKYLDLPFLIKTVTLALASMCKIVVDAGIESSAVTGYGQADFEGYRRMIKALRGKTNEIIKYMSDLQRLAPGHDFYAE